MERAAWLAEKRRHNAERYDTRVAADFDKEHGRINRTHRRMMRKFLALCPPDCLILDAACGTGKYWPMIRASHRFVLGIDQSPAMLQRAQEKFPHTPVVEMGMQEIAYENAFAGVICMDAMENVPPEDWPRVLGNFQRALIPRGHCYFTVETAAEEEIRAAFETGKAMGLPVVAGEYAIHGGYHYYPSIEQVREWTRAAGFAPIEETEGDHYYHFLMRNAE